MTSEVITEEEFLLDEETLRDIELMKGAGQWSIVWRRIKKDKMVCWVSTSLFS